MATILDLQQRKQLVRLDPDLDADELECRCIYVFPQVIADIEVLADQPSRSGSEITPEEQFYELLSHFASGGELITPWQFHELYHRPDDIWELKTRDLRLFGWFYQKDCFIGTALKDATFVKQGPPGFRISGSLYRGFGDEVVRLRRDLDLDEPKYVKGTSAENVVSNFSQG